MKIYIFFFLNIICFVSLNAQCVDNGNYWNQSWQSCQTSLNPNPTHGNSLWLMYEFHEPHSLDSTHIWNANRSGETSMGINEVIIEYTKDSSDQWHILGTYNFPQAPGSDTYAGFEGPNFDSLVVEKVLFTIISTHETPMDCASLAEVRFQTICTNIWYEDIDGDGLGNPKSTAIDCIAPENYVYNNIDTCDAMSWDDVYTIFNESNCTNCHGGSGGLNLSTYNNFIQGGNTCDLTIGTSLLDIIQNGLLCNGHQITPMNNYTNNPITSEDLARLQLWIDEGAKEFCSDCDEVEEPYNGIDDDCDPMTLDDDLDQDGFALAEDCDDTNPDINPEASEVVYNGIDDDCDPTTLDDDLDQDGFALTEDCDDTNPDINPQASEVVYNGIDDDCGPTTLDDDLDQDGFVLAEDCDDTNPDINPSAEEIVNNGIDEDCDGEDLLSTIHTLALNKLIVYPNPAVDFIFIKMKESLNFQTTIMNVQGKIISQTYNNQKIDVSGMPKGIYIIKIKDIKSGEKVVKKIVLEN